MNWLIPILFVASLGGQSVHAAVCVSGDDCDEDPAPGPTVRGEVQLKNFTLAAVTCDAPLCSEIAKGIMKKGGSITDAAIAGLICMGVVHPQSSGIGGGHVAVLYNATTGASKVFSARETAPMAATENMFDNKPKEATGTGGLAIAVPAEIRGFMELYNNTILPGGKVPFASLFEPTVRLLLEGFPVDSHLAGALKSSEAHIKNVTSLRQAFYNETAQSVYVEGNNITNPILAETLSLIAASNGQAFYDPKHMLFQLMLQDLKEAGSIITAEDIQNYKIQIQEPIKIKLKGNLTMMTAGPPSSGASKAFVLRILQKLNANMNDPIVRSQAITEAFKFAYGRRGKFGDPDDPTYKKRVADHVINLTQNDNYLNRVINKIKLNETSNDRNYYLEEKAKSNEYGTAHFAIVGPHGDAISVTTTIGKYFGAKVRSIKTGVIFNNKMNNFIVSAETRSVSPANKIGPGKRPMNTACPSIYTDEKGIVRLAIGGAGGMRIISSVTSSAINHLMLGQNIKEAISAPRIHHALRPMNIEIEPGFNKTILDALTSYGHKIVEIKPAASVVGISRDHNGVLWTSWDPRKQGSADGINSDPPNICQ